MQDFRNLTVWQKAHELALFTYRVTQDFPRDEIFGLRHSLRKSSVDVPAIIAEGCGKPNDSEFSRSVNAAFATACRLQYYGLVARDLELLSVEPYDEFERRVIEVKRLLSGLDRRLQ